MEKNKLCFILKQHIKFSESEYLRLKKDPNVSGHEDYRKKEAGLLKHAQKCLEYIRKDYKYEYAIEEDSFAQLIYNRSDFVHKINVFGRDTWTKCNKNFEVVLYNDEFKLYEEIYNKTELRERKLKRILGYERVK